MSITKPTVPFLDLKTPNRELSEEILAVWKKLLCNAAFVGGDEVASFEQELAAFCGGQHGIGVGSGSDALRLAILALGAGPGDEVITVANTFIATTEAIHQAGARAVLVDVDWSTANLDPSKLEAAITAKTKLIVPVHLYGQCAEMDPILAIARRHGIKVLEDAAQAHGATYKGKPAGSLGDAAAFSFYPSKNLGACGEAGAVITDDAEVAAKVRLLRDHGQASKHHHDIEGYNARLDAIQAAALRIKLRHLEKWNEQRREVARRYLCGLDSSGLLLPVEAEGREHVYHLFVVRHPERDAIRETLGKANIHSSLHYPVPLHLQRAYESMALGPGSFPYCEQWASWGLSLPIFPAMSASQVDTVCDAVNEMKLEPARPLGAGSK